MKREGLLRYLRWHGCILRREGKEHALWENPQTRHAEAVPGHEEIVNPRAKRTLPRAVNPGPAGLVQGQGTAMP
jgi:mRNA interferase HicA